MRALFIISLFMSGYSYALFTNVGGGIIEQTGTDADLSGLTFVTGVVIDTLEVNDYKAYRLPNMRLRVRGDLTIDPEIEILIIEAPNNELLIVDGTGSLTIGQATTQNGYTRYSEGTAIYLENTGAGFTNRVTFSGNSTFIWNGGVISIEAGKFGFYGDNVTVRINSTNAKLIYRTQDPQNQIRQETDDFISTGFTFINGDLTIVGTGQQLNGYNAIHCTGSFAFSGATPNVDVPIRGYTGGNKGNSADVKHWSGSRPVLINSEFGSQLNCGPHISGNGGSYGVALVRQEANISILNSANAPIQNARYFIRDIANGNRETYNREGHVVNNTADNVYTGITNASGLTTVFSVLLAANVVNNGNGDAINTGNYAWDYRGNNNDNTDQFDVELLSYNHNSNTLSDYVFKNNDTLNIVGSLSVDDNITEPLESNALAITGIAISHNPTSDSGIITISSEVTLCDLYDYMKAEKINSSIEQPSINSFPISASGSDLDVSNYQIVFTAAGKLNPCDKFQKIKSNIISSITNPIDNLGVALEDPNGTFKLIRIQDLDSADLVIYDNIGDSNLLSGTDTSGNVNFATQNNNNSVSIYATRAGYTEWATILDLTTADIFNLIVNQAEIDSSTVIIQSANKENQELQLYLLQKLIQKNEAILQSLDDTTFTNINLTLSTTTGSLASVENQEEIIRLLQRVLKNSVGIRERLKP